MTLGRFAKAFIWGGVVLFIILGAAFWVISYLPFTMVKAKIDTFASDQAAEPLNEFLFRKIVFKLRCVGTVLAGAAGVFYFTRRLLQQYLDRVFRSFGSLFKILSLQTGRALKKEDKIHLSMVFFILLFAVAVRICFLFQPIRNDEAYTFIKYASKPLYVGLSCYTAPNNHLFHTFLVHLCYLVLGGSAWVIRLPAFLAGIALVPITYLAGRLFYNKYAALMAAALVAANSTLIEYSTNARGYTLICCFFLLIWALAKFLLQERNLAGVILWAILSSLGFYTIPIMLYPFGMVMIWMLLLILFHDAGQPRGRRWKDFFAAVVLTVVMTFILYVPVFIAVGLRPVIANADVAPLSWDRFIERIPSALSALWHQWNRDIPRAVEFLFIIGFVTSLILHKRSAAHRIPIVLAVVIWCVPVLMVQRVIPFERVWLFLLPLFFILASSGLSYIYCLINSQIGKARPIFFTTLIVVVSGWMGINAIRSQSVYYSEEGAFRDAEDIVLFLKERLEPQDSVVAGFNAAPLEYYFMAHEVPVQYLADADESIRVWTAVNGAPAERLNDILALHGVSRTDFTKPRLIKKFDFAELYQMDRIYKH